MDKYHWVQVIGLTQTLAPFAPAAAIIDASVLSWLIEGDPESRVHNAEGFHYAEPPDSRAVPRLRAPFHVSTPSIASAGEEHQATVGADRDLRRRVAGRDHDALLCEE
jgi:hypothetical protein